MVEGTAAWGTTPVRPYDPRGPVGIMQEPAGGLQAPVGAVLLDDRKESLLLVALAGPRVAIAALFAHLLQGKMVAFSAAFTPATEAWRSELSPETWLRASGNRQIAVPLSGMRGGVVAVLLSQALDLKEYCSRSPIFPQKKPEQPQEEPSERQAPVKGGSAVLLGNDGESRPALSTFLAFLQAVQVILPAGALRTQWADVLWDAGEQAGLIQPLTGAGVRGWRLVGEAARWNDLALQHRKQLLWPM